MARVKIGDLPKNKELNQDKTKAPSASAVRLSANCGVSTYAGAGTPMPSSPE
jgi:hypothetical protein